MEIDELLKLEDNLYCVIDAIVQSHILFFCVNFKQFEGSEFTFAVQVEFFTQGLKPILNHNIHFKPKFT